VGGRQIPLSNRVRERWWERGQLGAGRDLARGREGGQLGGGRSKSTSQQPGARGGKRELAGGRASLLLDASRDSGPTPASPLMHTHTHTNTAEIVVTDAFPSSLPFTHTFSLISSRFTLSSSLPQVPPAQRQALLCGPAEGAGNGSWVSFRRCVRPQGCWCELGVPFLSPYLSHLPSVLTLHPSVYAEVLLSPALPPLSRPQDRTAQSSADWRQQMQEVDAQVSERGCFVSL
jgi:hypothetical protein